MDEWEYRILDVRVADYNWSLSYGGRKYRGMDGAEDCVNLLGKDGWELVSVGPWAPVSAHTEHYTLFFKRRKRGDEPFD